MSGFLARVVASLQDQRLDVRIGVLDRREYAEIVSRTLASGVQLPDDLVSEGRVCSTLESPVRLCGSVETDRYLTGWKCVAHSPSVTAGRPPIGPVELVEPSPARERHVHGQAKTDPLGREVGKGWHKNARTGMLPVKTKD